MRDYQIVWSREAMNDVATTADYIELRFGKERADRFNDDIEKEGDILAVFYDAFSETDIEWMGNLIRKKVFQPSLIFYCVDKQRQCVYILRVLRCEENWQHKLRKGVFTFG